MGLSTATSALQDGSRLIAPDGTPFFSLSINYNARLTPGRERLEVQSVDAAQLLADFARIRDLGANTVRAFVSAGMAEDLDNDSWDALDAFVEAAKRNRLLLSLCLAECTVSDLRSLVGRVGKVAARYASDPTILALDLMNHPGFTTLALAREDGRLPSFETVRCAEFASGLAEAEALCWARGEGGVPDWVGDDQAIRYAILFAAFRGIVREATSWVEGQQRPANIIDFVRSPEARRWIPLLELLDDLLERWLRPQVDALRAADPLRLVTVCWGDPLLASLRANEVLDILSLSRFPAAGARWLSHHLDVARSLRLAFPTKPVLMAAFGVLAHDINPPEAAVAESAIWLGAFERGLAGAGKWTMFDLPADSPSSDRSFGLVSYTGESKAGAWALPALSRFLGLTRQPRGHLETFAGPGGQFDYRFTADDALFASGRDAIDHGGLRWEGRGTAQLFADWSTQGEIALLTTAPGQITVDLSRLLGLAGRPGLTVSTEGRPLSHERRGNTVSFWAAPGQRVVCRIGLQCVDATIVTVRPIRGARLEEADAAILTAYLTYPGSHMAVPLGFAPAVTLWCARGEYPAHEAARGVRRLVDNGDRKIPVWEFDNVDLRSRSGSSEELTFSLSVAGMPYRTNVWVIDARPVGVSRSEPAAISLEDDLCADAITAQISAVHLNEQPYRLGAKRVDIRVTLSMSDARHAQFGELLALGEDEGGIWLMSARNNAVGERRVRGVPVLGGKSSLEWMFRSVELQPMTDPSDRLHFWIEVEGLLTRSSFWTYGPSWKP